VGKECWIQAVQRKKTREGTKGTLARFKVWGQLCRKGEGKGGLEGGGVAQNQKKEGSKRELECNVINKGW